MIEEQKSLPEPKNQLDTVISKMADPSMTAEQQVSLRNYAEVVEIRDAQALDEVRKRLQAVQWSVENGKLTDDPGNTDNRFQAEDVLQDLEARAETVLHQPSPNRITPPQVKEKRKLGPYDGTYQMYVDSVHEANVDTLRSLRWAVEQGRVGHGVAGPSTGEYAEGPKPSLPDKGIVYKSPDYTGKA